MAQPLPQGTNQLLQMLNDVAPTVPEELGAHCLRSSGASAGAPSPHLAKLVSLAGQRLLSIAIQDALQASRRKLGVNMAARKALGYNPKDKRLMLGAEEVAEVLAAYGVAVRPAPYYVDQAQR